MKRMVENSEKIEELADIVEIKNGDIVTSNITTTGGDKIHIFSDRECDLNSDFPGSIIVTNIGSALILEAYINSGTSANNYPMATIFIPDDDISYVQLSNGNEFNTGITKGMGPNEFVITTEFNETLADHTKTRYKLIVLIGRYSKEL